MAKKQTPNILIPPDQVQVKVAEWQSHNEPVLVAKRPLTFASLLIDNQSQCGLVVDKCPQIQQML